MTEEDMKHAVAEALDAADRRREERAVRQLATQNLEGLRKRYADQLEVLVRLAARDPAIEILRLETAALLSEIDARLARHVAENADLIREGIRQARAELHPAEPAPLALLPGAQLISSHGRRR
jgi:hypothetical protein